MLKYTEGPYEEKRKSPRVNVVNKVSARIIGKHIHRLLKIVNISCHGAFMRIPRFIQKGELLQIFIYLPVNPKPLIAEARVVRTVTTCSALGFLRQYGGVEFVNPACDVRDKLADTVDSFLG